MILKLCYACYEKRYKKQRYSTQTWGRVCSDCQRETRRGELLIKVIEPDKDAPGVG